MAVLENERHEKFCHEYMKDLNLSQAYMRTYPDAKSESARRLGSKLLTNVDIQRRIQELMEARAKRMNISADAVIKRLADIAFGHLGMICVWTETGLDIKEREELTDGELSIIDSLDISPVGDGDGGLLGYRKKVKLRDSLKALELLSRHLGLLDGAGSEDKGRTKGAIAARLLELADRIKAKASGEPRGSGSTGGV